jgi:hypothetical protein
MRRRVDECERIVEQLPPLDRAYEIDFRLLSARLAEIPDDVNGVLKLFDGRRTLQQVLDEADHDGVSAAKALARLWSEQVIRPAAAPPPSRNCGAEGQGDGIEVAEWFSGPAEPASVSPVPEATRAAGAGTAALPPDSPPRIVRFPARRKERRPPLQIETTSAYPLLPARAEPREFPVSPTSRRSAAIRRVPRMRSVAATALLVAAAVLAGVGIWRIMADALRGSGKDAAPAIPALAAPPERPSTPASGKGD